MNVFIVDVVAGSLNSIVSRLISLTPLFLKIEPSQKKEHYIYYQVIEFQQLKVFIHRDIVISIH